MLEEHHFKQQNVYNMDETSFKIGTSQCNKVVIDSSLRTHYKVEPGQQEWVTVVKYICANGSVIIPLIIFKAKHISNN
jgi:aminoglycoside N3'-acetyltransferase